MSNNSSSTSSLITFGLSLSSLCLINQLLFDGMITSSKTKYRRKDHNLTTWRSLISAYQLTLIFKNPKWHMLHDKLAQNQCRRLQLNIFIIVYQPARIGKVGTLLSQVLIPVDNKIIYWCLSLQNNWEVSIPWGSTISRPLQVLNWSFRPFRSWNKHSCADHSRT